MAAVTALSVCAAGCEPQSPEPAPPAASAATTADVEAGLRAIDAQAIRAHLRFLSDDLLEGRAPGTRGGRLAAEYIATQFEAMGLESVGGSYLQRVPIMSVTADPAATRLAFSGPRGTLAAKHIEDFVGWTLTQKPEVEASGEVVFAGFGIVAPEYG